MTTINPIKNNLYIAQNKKEDTTEMGIIISNGLGNTASAYVLAVGPDVTECKVGDTVYVDWSKSYPVTIDGVQRAMIKIDHVIAVVED